MRRLLCILLSLAMVACAAKSPWVSTRVPKGQWDHDWSMCKLRAENRVGGYRDWDAPTHDDPFAAYDRQEMKEPVDDLVASCMIGLGYVPAGKPK